MKAEWILSLLFTINMCLIRSRADGTTDRRSVSYYHITRVKDLDMTRVKTGAELEGLLVRDRTLNVLLHGLGGSYNHTSNWLLANALFEIGEENIVVVDYEEMVPASDYDRAVKSCEKAGKDLAGFLSDVTFPLQLVGFSLGAHVAGVAAHDLRTVYNQTVSRIIGLDPANPIFESMDAALRLDYSDADLVMVIHTAGGAMGGLEPIGHVDFYPNGGREPQPQCTLPTLKSELKALYEIMCSHSAAYIYLADSVRGGYTATRCSSWEDYRSDRCMGAPTLHMGFRLPDNARGTYFLSTTQSTPMGDPGEDYVQDPDALNTDDNVLIAAASDSEKQSDAWTLLTAIFIISSQVMSVYVIWHYTPH